nr:MAG TPA: hypothetical protein [Caudoviricetes sp.]
MSVYHWDEGCQVADREEADAEERPQDGTYQDEEGPSVDRVAIQTPEVTHCGSTT